MSFTRIRKVLHPKKLIPASQAWFWTDSWQEGEREASSERGAGLGEVFRSDEEFLASLRSTRPR